MLNGLTSFTYELFGPSALHQAPEFISVVDDRMEAVQSAALGLKARVAALLKRSAPLLEGVRKQVGPLPGDGFSSSLGSKVKQAGKKKKKSK